MCVEKCPEKFMTLIKAYSNKNDFDYYKKFCKDGVTNTMVSLKSEFKLMDASLFLFYLCYCDYWNVSTLLLSCFCIYFVSGCTRYPQIWSLSCHADPEQTLWVGSQSIYLYWSAKLRHMMMSQIQIDQPPFIMLAVFSIFYQSLVGVSQLWARKEGW